MKISCAIITYNEDQKISDCLLSVMDIVDEIIVVDSYSTDRTKEMVLQFENVSFIENKLEGHIQQKNYAVSHCTHNYILSLDADEILSPALVSELILLKSAVMLADAYEMPRLNNYCGQWIRHGGWYPDRKIRLWNKSMGAWGGVNPHDKVVLNPTSNIKRLHGDILHFTVDSVKDHLNQEKKFAKIASKQISSKKINFLFIFMAILNPPFTFIKKYLIQAGFLDGWYGLIIASISAYGKFLKYVYSSKKIPPSN